MNARRAPGDVVLPAAGFGLDEALRLQLAVADRFVAGGDRVGGWKVGLTAGGTRDMMGEGFRPFGYVLERQVFSSGAEIDLGRMLNCGIEPELSVVVGSELSGCPSVDEVRAAVRGVAPAFELNELRVPGGRDADHATLVADGLGNWGIVVGDVVPMEALSDGLTVSLFRDGERVARETAGVWPIDDPFLSVSRLVALLDRFGRRLEAGQTVITGSFATLRVQGPSEWRAEFEGVGNASVRFV